MLLILMFPLLCFIQLHKNIIYSNFIVKFHFKLSYNPKKAMNLTNVALQTVGAKIKTYSSCQNPQEQPNNILTHSEQSLWTTAQGLPQFVIVSLQNLNIRYKNVMEVGFMLWHDYQTNPKLVELWVAQTTEQQFSFWAQFQLQQKSGIQVYPIPALSSRYIYLKISVTQTYGGLSTYLNQLFLMCEGVVPVNSGKLPKTTSIKELYESRRREIVQNKRKGQEGNKKRELGLEDLEAGLNELVEMDRRMSGSKEKRGKGKGQKVLNRASREGVNKAGMIEGENKGTKRGTNKTITRQQQSNSNLISKGSQQSKYSKGSRRGLSIYYRSQDKFQQQSSQHQHQQPQQQQSSSRQYTSQQYNSSSSNNNNNTHLYNTSSQRSQSFQSHTVLSPPMGRQREAEGRMAGEREKKRGRVRDEEEEINEEEEQNQDEQQQEQQQLEAEELQQQQQQFSNQLIKNTPHYKQLSQHHQSPSQQNQQHSQQQQQSSDQSSQPNNYNIAILALSKHLIKLEDNMDQINRKVQVLDMKVGHSHQKLKEELLGEVEGKVEEIVQRKLNKVWSLKGFQRKLSAKKQRRDEGKDKENQYKREREDKSNSKDPRDKTKKQHYLITNNKHQYKKNLTKQFFKSDYCNQDRIFNQSRDKTKTKRLNRDNNNNKYTDRQVPYNGQRQRRQNRQKEQHHGRHNKLTSSKSFADISSKPLGQNPQPNQTYIATLLERLNSKLKQRQAKLYRMQLKQKQKQKRQKSSQDQKRQQQQERDEKYYLKRREQRRVVTGSYEYY